MNVFIRIAMVLAGFALAALPAVQAADETQPPPPAPGGPNAAQPDRPGWHGRRMDPAQRLQHLSEVLNLTDDQKTRIAPMLKDQQAKMQALGSDDSLSREDRRAKMMGLMKETQGQIRALLTPEQQEKFDAMPRPGRGPRGEGPGGAHPPPPAADNPPAGGSA